jgi:ABC-type branched-subunit amino acid transport system substrate-binding protein
MQALIRTPSDPADAVAAPANGRRISRRRDRIDARYGIAVLLLSALAASAASAQTTTVRIAFLGTADTDAHYGARQGIDEANTQGKFLGLRYELVTVDDAAQAVAVGPAAIVAAVSPLRVLKLAADAAGIPVLNVTAPDDELREECIGNLFHTIPSLAMREDAVQQWRRKNPRSAALARAWHPALTKYAGAQLNQRYSAAYRRPMTDEAWAAWAAVKLVSDTVARTQNVDPAMLLESMQTELAFDGQKGIDMSFRDTGQLRQPLLLVENDEIVGEAPVLGIVGITNLDSLGLPECPK